MGMTLTEEAIEGLAEGLFVLKKTQHFISSKSPDGPKVLEDWTDPEFVRNYCLAMIVEVTEFMNELNWKPWLTEKKKVDREKLIMEAADILAFLGVILKMLSANGISTTDLARAYDQKSTKNLARFAAQKLAE